MKEKTENIIHWSTAPTAFSDLVNIAGKEDGCVLLQFMSTLPDRLVENFRTMMTREGTIALIDNLSIILDHYPVKETSDKNQ